MMPALTISHRPARYSRSRQGREQAGIDEHRQRLMEAADQVLADRQVDAGLAADGGVHLRQQRGGDLQHRNAAHEDGGQKSAHVGDDAAAEGDDHAGAVAARAHHFARRALRAAPGACCPRLQAGGGRYAARRRARRTTPARRAATRLRWTPQKPGRPWAAGTRPHGPRGRAPPQRSSSAAAFRRETWAYASCTTAEGGGPLEDCPALLTRDKRGLSPRGENTRGGLLRKRQEAG